MYVVGISDFEKGEFCKYYAVFFENSCYFTNYYVLWFNSVSPPQDDNSSVPYWLLLRNELEIKN